MNLPKTKFDEWIDWFKNHPRLSVGLIMLFAISISANFLTSVIDAATKSTQAVKSLFFENEFEKAESALQKELDRLPIPNTTKLDKAK